LRRSLKRRKRSGTKKRSGRKRRKRSSSPQSNLNFSQIHPTFFTI